MVIMYINFVVRCDLNEEEGKQEVEEAWKLHV